MIVRRVAQRFLRVGRATSTTHVCRISSKTLRGRCRARPARAGPSLWVPHSRQRRVATFADVRTWRVRPLTLGAAHPSLARGVGTQNLGNPPRKTWATRHPKPGRPSPPGLFPGIPSRCTRAPADRKSRGCRFLQIPARSRKKDTRFAKGKPFANPVSLGPGDDVPPTRSRASRGVRLALVRHFVGVRVEPFRFEHHPLLVAHRQR
jgi:hypothetical protein